MRVKSLVLVVMALGMAALIGAQVIYDYARNRIIIGEMEELNEKLETLKEENEKIRKEISFFSESRNLEKELRSRFNFKLPGEEVIIVVPRE